MAIVVYGKTPVGCCLQPEGSTAAAVGGTVWSPHPKAGPFDYCVFSVQGRLIEWQNCSCCTWQGSHFRELDWAFRSHQRGQQTYHRKHLSKKEMRSRLLRSGLHPHPGPIEGDGMIPDRRFFDTEQQDILDECPHHLVDSIGGYGDDGGTDMHGTDNGEQVPPPI